MFITRNRYVWLEKLHICRCLRCFLPDTRRDAVEGERNGASRRYAWKPCRPSAKIGRVSDGMSGNEAGGLRRWQAEQGVLDSGDAGFQRHIGVIREPEIWPRVFVQMGSWSRWWCQKG